MTRVIRFAIRLAVAGSLVLGATPIRAQSTGADGAPETARPADREALGEALDRFATIAGGWHLEQRCHHLAAALKKELDWNVAQANVVLLRAVDPRAVLQIQQAAKETADKIPCGPQSDPIVMSTLALSRELAQALTGQVYSAAAQAEFDAKRIATILFAQAIDDHCSIMPAEIRRELNGLVETITTDFDQTVGAVALARVRAASLEAFAKNPPPCDDRSVLILRNALNEARQMAAK